MSDLSEINSYEITFTTNDPDNSGQTVTTNFYEIIRPDTVDMTFTYE